MQETSDRAGRRAVDLDGELGGGAAVDPDRIATMFEALKDVVDPELGINVVDLGLVYDLMVDENDCAIVDMTLTSPACPLTDMIEDQVGFVLTQGVDGQALASDYRINWVWLPPWDFTKISDDGRDQLRALGFSI